MKDAFVHIGYPKCASTALQSNFFSQLPEVFYLGPYTGGVIFPYYNDDIKYTVEVDWRLMKDFGYDQAKAAGVIEICYDDFLASGRKTFGFSSEALVFTLHHDIDVTQKAARLFNILGHDTKIIMVIRRQFDLIRSIYRNMILIGLTSSFSKFVSDMVYNK